MQVYIMLLGTDPIGTRKSISMILVLVIIILISIIMGFVLGNFLFNLSLNPKTSKNIIFNNDFDEEQERRKIENEKWLAKNGKKVFVENKKTRLQGYEVKNCKESNIWVIAVHGYVDSAASMVPSCKQFLIFGYNVLMPNLRTHEKSEGKYIGMGWLDRLDLLKWIEYLNKKYENIKIILYGISMGAATVMMASGEKLPSNVKAIVEDCGYTSVWEEFSDKLKTLFHLPQFPTLYYANLITKIKAGYSLKKASCINQLKKSVTPILFIHGDKDKFVPFYMLDQLYNSANCKKEKLIIQNAGHAEAQEINPEKYWRTVKNFIKKHIL